MDRFTAHMDRAWDWMAKGDTGRALISAKKALDVNDESPEAHNLVGYIYALEGDVDEALARYRQAMTLDEWYIDPLLNSAELLVHPEADPLEAIEFCRKVTDMVTDPEDRLEALLLEVDALLNLERVDEARRRLENIEKVEELPAAFALLIGRAHFEAGNVVVARRFIDRALDHDPGNVDALYYFGQIARDEGRRIDATKAFVEVLAADVRAPDPPWIEQMEPPEALVAQAISALGDTEKKMIEGAEVSIEALPSLEMVQNEIDPRQAVLAEKIDPERRAFDVMRVFIRNLYRGGALPDTAVAELTELIRREIGGTPKPV